MAILPEDIPTGKVTGQFYFVNEDTIEDPDQYPQLTVVNGFVRFKASIKVLRMSARKAVVIPLTFDAKFNSEGKLVPADHLESPEGIYLPATDSTEFDTTGWTWTATFEIKDANTGHTIQIDPITFQVPVGSELDLSTIVPAPASPGVITTRGPKGAKGDKGDKGDIGPSPTDPQVAGYLSDPESESSSALSAAIGESIQGMVSSSDVGTIRTTYNPNEVPANGELLLLLAAPTVIETFPTLGAGMPTGWSQKYSSASTVSVTADGLVASKDDVVSELFAWDNATAILGSRADAEILVKVKIAGSSAAIIGPFAYLRGGGDAETRQGIGFGWRGGTSAQLRLYRYVDGASTSIGQADGVFPADTWAWIRFQAIGTTARGRMWLDGATEPSTWDITATVPAPSPGFVGVFTQRNTIQTMGYVSVGYNGASAPMEA